MGKSTTAVCSECGQSANVYVSSVKTGGVQTAAFCQAHAEAAGILDEHGYGLLDKSEPIVSKRLDGTLRCPVCDCSQRDFERQGRVGCPACYQAFAGLLPPMLTRMHRGTAHRGKIPQRHADAAIMRHRLAQLQAELNDAVRTEQFEWAAKTRNAIHTLTTKLLAPTGLLATGRPGTGRELSREAGSGNSSS
jgi:protein arginine kinase activator